MTAEIDAEFWRVLLAAWGCFAMGVAIWHYRKELHGYGLQPVGRLLLAISPALLSAFGYHSTEAVRTVELMAQAVPVRHVGHEIEPVIADRDTILTPGGATVDYIRTNYGPERRGAGSVRVGDEHTGRRGEGSGRGFASVGAGVTGSVPLPLWQR
jgi:hypothetical protein